MTQTEPTCGKCGKVMTPENSRRRPELFTCDDCLGELVDHFLPSDGPPRVSPTVQAEHTEELRKSSILIGRAGEDCGGGIHYLVDRLQAERVELLKKIEELRREREAVKDCLKITDTLSALAAIERIVYTGAVAPPQEDRHWRAGQTVYDVCSICGERHGPHGGAC